MIGMSLLSFVLLLAPGAESVIANPGFEEVEAGKPSRWSLFVMPQRGAEGRLDDESFDGHFSAMLHIPTEYEKDPANNWSQKVIRDVAGKELRASAYIKTDEATEAAIWIQCWRRSPVRILSTSTSSAECPVYGSADWTRVFLNVEAPEATSFVVLRCVLFGRGTAWFDEVRLEIEGTEEDESEDAAQDEDEAEPRDEKTAADSSPTGIGDAVAEAMRETNRAMIDTNETLRAANEMLLEQVRSLQGQLDALRDELQYVKNGAADLTLDPIEPAELDAPAIPVREEPSIAKTLSIPPLVPQGFDIGQLE
jgi:hypothetical protein